MVSGWWATWLVGTLLVLSVRPVQGKQKHNTITPASPQMQTTQSALQAATILVAMASGKNIWRPKCWRNSPIGHLQCTDLKRNLLEKLSKIADEFNQ